jgi:hypothetical protein
LSLSTLIFGDLRDPHVVAVRDALRARGTQTYVFSRYDRRCQVCLEVYDNSPVLRFSVLSEEILSTSLKSIWWRQKPFGLFYPDKPDRNVIQEFIGREWHQFLNGLSPFLSSARWINPIEMQLRANSKPTQLLWASRAGFTIPRTVFTNDISSVRTLVEEGNAVYKTFSGYMFPESSTIFTSRIGAEFLAEDASNRVGVAPGIYQHYVPKDYEVRIYFINNNVFTVKIDSQRSEDTKTDWRENQALDINTFIETKTNWLTKVLRFRSLSGLVFGAIDAVITPEDDIVFLECNPAGQWLSNTLVFASFLAHYY